MGVEDEENESEEVVTSSQHRASGVDEFFYGGKQTQRCWFKYLLGRFVFIDKLQHRGEGFEQFCWTP